MVVVVLGRLVFPYTKYNEDGMPVASWPRRSFGWLGRGILLLAAVGLVLPGLLPGQHWLLPASAVTLAALLACAALANLLAWRPASFLVAGVLLAVTCGVAYWELGELYWIGVLPV